MLLFSSFSISRYSTSAGEVVELLKDAMSSVAERDIYTGDAAIVCVIDAETGVTFQEMALKED